MKKELGIWLVFLLVMGVVGWYMGQILYCPYWSKEPVLHTYDLVRHLGLLNSTWKRGMTSSSSSHKYLDYGGVKSWKASDAGFSGAIEKMGGFLKKEWISSLGDISGDTVSRIFTLSSTELEKGAGRGAVISTCSLLKTPVWPVWPVYDTSFSRVSDTSGGGYLGDGWIMSYPVYYWFSDSGWSCGGVLGDLLGGRNRREKSGETWKVDYLCVRRSMEKKERVEVARKLFTTHLYRLVFPDLSVLAGKGGGKGGGNEVRRNSALFRGDPMEESMRKVVPIVRFQVWEVELAEKEIWPLSKRWGAQGRRKWVLMGGKDGTVMENRLWRNWLEGWYSGGGGIGGNGGAMGGFRMVSIATLAMFLDKMATGDWFVWVLFRPMGFGKEGEVENMGLGDAEEIEAVLCFRNERCLLERKEEIRGMAGSGTEVFTLMGSWFLAGVSVKEGREIFRRGLREMRRVRKTFRMLRVEEMGYNVGLLDSLRVSGSGYGGNELLIGKVVKRDWMAYYFYNRFWGEVDALRCFVVL
jgi:hypothetical protein